LDHNYNTFNGYLPLHCFHLEQQLAARYAQCSACCRRFRRRAADYHIDAAAAATDRGTAPSNNSAVVRRPYTITLSGHCDWTARTVQHTNWWRRRTVTYVDKQMAGRVYYSCDGFLLWTIFLLTISALTTGSSQGTMSGHIQYRFWLSLDYVRRPTNTHLTYSL
jgi:hypothetical protein